MSAAAPRRHLERNDDLPRQSMRRPSRFYLERAARSRVPERWYDSEAGDTLVEVLLALVVLGLASVAMLVAFATSISASAEHRSLATFDTELRSASEQIISQIQQQTNPQYESCAPVADYQAGGTNQVTFSLPAGYTAKITSVQYWNGSSFISDRAWCAANMPNAPQWITMTLIGPNGVTYTNSFFDGSPITSQSLPSGVATQLVFAAAPANTSVGALFANQPVVLVEDAKGNVVTTDLSPVTLAITSGTGTSGATLSLGCSGIETSGVVTFSNCSINLVGQKYTLSATDGTLYP